MCAIVIVPPKSRFTASPLYREKIRHLQRDLIEFLSTLGHAAVMSPDTLPNSSCLDMNTVMPDGWVDQHGDLHLHRIRLSAIQEKVVAWLGGKV